MDSRHKLFRKAIERDNMAAKKYVSLHDIAKADCMTVEYGDGSAGNRDGVWKEDGRVATGSPRPL